jgi:hypothetical protein
MIDSAERRQDKLSPEQIKIIERSTGGSVDNLTEAELVAAMTRLGLVQLQGVDQDKVLIDEDGTAKEQEGTEKEL